MAVTADGSSVLVNDLKAAQNPDVSVASITTKGPSTPLLQSPATERAVDLSPDGKFIAYESAESEKLEIFVRPFPNVNDGKWQISTAGGTKAAWSPTGRELFYVDSTGMLMSVPVQLSPAFKAGNPTKLFPAANIATLASGRFYDASRDGQKFVMIKELPPPPGQPTTPIGPTFVVVLNWLQELKVQTGK
jgi:serine/threonine-protein kinase